MGQLLRQWLGKRSVPNNRELVVYSRAAGCPYQDTAYGVFKKLRVTFREIMIDKDEAAAARVVAWTGFRSVPTIVAAEPGMDVPYTEPAHLEAGASPRGINRGAIITEASAEQLEAWLKQEGFLK